VARGVDRDGVHVGFVVLSWNVEPHPPSLYGRARGVDLPLRRGHDGEVLCRRSSSWCASAADRALVLLFGSTCWVSTKTMCFRNG
jgi:hypothetical protein